MDKALEDFCTLGKIIYDGLTEYKDIRFIVCPCSLGDTVNIGAFASTYKKIHNVDKLILVVKEHQVPLAGIFSGVDQAFEVSETEMMGLRFYLTVNRMEKANNVLYGYFPMKETDVWDTANSKIFIEEQEPLSQDFIMTCLQDLDNALENGINREEAIALLRHIIPTYQPPEIVNSKVK